MKRSLLIALMALGISGTASANDDVTVILGNVPNTVTVLAEGLATLGDIYTTTESFEAVGSEAGTELLMRPTIALVQDAPTLGALSENGGAGTGLLLEVTDTVGGHVGALLDDPTAEGIEQNLLASEDIGTIARNIPQMLEYQANGEHFFATHLGREFDEFLQDGNLSSHYDTGVWNTTMRNIPEQTLRDTALHNHYSGIGSNIANMHVVFDLATTGLFGMSYRDALFDPLQPYLVEHMVPVVNQSLLGQSSIADVSENLEFESTFEFINYEGMLEAAGL